MACFYRILQTEDARPIVSLEKTVAFAERQLKPLLRPLPR
jgi:hypothetical protein